MPNIYVSPCKKICELVNDICIGCGRTKEEISNWTKITHEERILIMKKLEGIDYGISK